MEIYALRMSHMTFLTDNDNYVRNWKYFPVRYGFSKMKFNRYFTMVCDVIFKCNVQIGNTA